MRDANPTPRPTIAALLAGWVRRVRRRPAAVVVAAVVLAVIGTVQTARALRIDTSTLDMLSEDLPFRQNFEALDEAFPQDYRTILVVVDSSAAGRAARAAEALANRLAADSPHARSVFYPDADPFFRRNGLLYLSVDALQDLADRLAAAQPLLAALAADPSLRGLASVLTLALEQTPPGALPPEFEDALARTAETVETVAAARPEPLAWRQMLGGGQPAAGDERRKVIVVEPVLDFASLAPAAPAIAEIRRAIAETGADAGDVRVRLTGELLMLQDELASVEDNIGLVAALSFVLVLLLLVPGLRSWRLFFATTTTLVIGLILTAWFAATAFGALNLISVTFAVLFIGLGIDFGIHYALRVQEFVDRGVGPGLALEEAAAGAGPGLILSAVAAASGFLAFLPTAYKGLAELGAIAAVGMLIAVFLNLTLLPALLALIPPGRRAGGVGRAGSAALRRAPAVHPRLTVTVAAVLALLALITLPRARFDDSAFALRDPRSESVSTILDLLDDVRVDPFRAMVLAPDAESGETLARRLEALPEVREVVTLGDLVPDRQAEKLAIIDQIALYLGPVLLPQSPPPAATIDDLRAALVRLATAAEARAGDSTAAARLAAAIDRGQWSDEALRALDRALVGDIDVVLDDLDTALRAEPFAVDDLPPALLERRRTADGRVLVEIFANEDQRRQEHRRRFAAAVQSVAPDASGESIVVTEAGRAVVGSFYEAGLYAAVMIAGLLFGVLRNARDAFLVAVPLMLASLLTVATGVVIGVPFNFANVIVLPLLFGLGVAGGIHMVLRARGPGAAAPEPTSTPRAVLFSALTTIGSFGSLAVSTHPGMASMGILLTIALVWTTLTTLVVLPALRATLLGRSPDRRW
jgi:hypothetical protein